MRLAIIIFFLLFNSYVNSQIYKGGNSDGYSYQMVSNLSFLATDSVYHGGSANGFYTSIVPSLSISVADPLYNGGGGVGFTTTILSVLAFAVNDTLYNGGSGKGEDVINTNLNLSTCGAVIVWNGSVSTAWENPANWGCDLVPWADTYVVIPTGLSRYPIVSSNTEIRGIQLQNGAKLTIKSNVLFKLNNQ